MIIYPDTYIHKPSTHVLSRRNPYFFAAFGYAHDPRRSRFESLAGSWDMAGWEMDHRKFGDFPIKTSITIHSQWRGIFQLSPCDWWHQRLMSAILNYPSTHSLVNTISKLFMILGMVYHCRCSGVAWKQVNHPLATHRQMAVSFTFW